jgi:hypothetical protein
MTNRHYRLLRDLISKVLQHHASAVCDSRALYEAACRILKEADGPEEPEPSAPDLQAPSAQETHEQLWEQKRRLS